MVIICFNINISKFVYSYYQFPLWNFFVVAKYKMFNSLTFSATCGAKFIKVSYDCNTKFNAICTEWGNKEFFSEPP